VAAAIPAAAALSTNIFDCLAEEDEYEAVVEPDLVVEEIENPVTWSSIVAREPVANNATVCKKPIEVVPLPVVTETWPNFFSQKKVTNCWDSLRTCKSMNTTTETKPVVVVLEDKPVMSKIQFPIKGFNMRNICWADCDSDDE